MATETQDRRAIFIGERSVGTARMFWRLSMRHEDYQLWCSRCAQLGIDAPRHLEETIRASILGRLAGLHHDLTRASAVDAGDAPRAVTQ